MGSHAPHIKNIEAWTIVVSAKQCYCFCFAGIGYETAKALLQQNFNVTIACRDPSRATGAVSKLKAEVPGADVDWLQLDLADLQSVKQAATTWLDNGKQIDVLLNNAGVHHTLINGLHHSCYMSNSPDASAHSLPDLWLLVDYRPAMFLSLQPARHVSWWLNLH